jgi:heme-degrading monooxygenase HmoA
MALVVITVPPGPTDEAFYDAVNMKLGEEVPDGLIVHTAGRNENGEFQIVDVWESREAHDRFSQGRLWDAIQAVARERGMEADRAPEPRRAFYEAHHVMVRQPEAAAH